MKKRLRLTLAIIAALVACSLLAQYLTATLGVNTVRSAILPAPGQAVSGVECRVVFPGVVRCSYYERRSKAAGPKEGGRVYESDYLWYGFGCVRLRHVLSEVT